MKTGLIIGFIILMGFVLVTDVSDVLTVGNNIIGENGILHNALLKFVDFGELLSKIKDFAFKAIAKNMLVFDILIDKTMYVYDQVSSFFENSIGWLIKIFNK